MSLRHVIAYAVVALAWVIVGRKAWREASRADRDERRMRAMRHTNEY